MSETIANAICVYCASNNGTSEEYRKAAESLGRAIATSGRTLIYGGGSAGLMGATSRACKAAGGKQVGIVPRAIAGAGGEGIGNGQRGYDPDETIFVESMHERKTLMAMKAGGGFVALPGGFGTFEEILEAITWVQLGIHQKAIVLVNVEGFWEPLRALIKGAVESGFIKSGYGAIVTFVDKPEGVEDFDWGAAALEAVSAWTPPKSGPLFSTWKLELSQS